MKITLDPLDALPAQFAWLSDGPSGTAAAVIRAKRRLITRQLPLALAMAVGFAAAKSLGLIEPNGHARFFVHLLVAMVFFWPPTFAHVGVAARRDARHASPPLLKRQLTGLWLGSHLVAGFTSLMLLGMLAMYLVVVNHLIR